MPQLGHFQLTVRGSSGNALSGVNVTLYREGATVNGNQSGVSPLTVTVRHPGRIIAADTVFINTTTGTSYTVDSKTNTTVVLSGFAGTLTLTDKDRLVPSNTLPTLYSDDQGGATTGNPLSTSSTGYAQAYSQTGAYEVLISGGSATTTLFQSQVIPAEAPTTFYSSETDSATAIAHDFNTRFTLSTLGAGNIAGGAMLLRIRNNDTERFSIDWEGRTRLQAADINIASGGTRVGLTSRWSTPASPGTSDDVAIWGRMGLPAATTIAASRVASGTLGSCAATSGATINGSLLGIEGGTLLGGAISGTGSIFGLKGNIGGDGTETGTLTNAYAIFGDPNQSAFAVALTVTNVYGVWAGMPLSGTNRWALWSDGTTKINGRLDFGTTNGGITSSTGSVVLGASGVASPVWQLHASAALTEATLTLKQIASQTGNMLGCRNSSNTVICGVGPGGPLFTFVKAGVPADADFTTAPPDGSLAANSGGTGTFYVRLGGVWRSVALT